MKWRGGLLDKFRNSIFGIILATFCWSSPSSRLSEISNKVIRLLGLRGSSWPIKELFLRTRDPSLVLFSSSQMGKLPVKLLWERSTTVNLNWCRRNQEGHRWAYSWIAQELSTETGEPNQLDIQFLPQICCYSFQVWPLESWSD